MIRLVTILLLLTPMLCHAQYGVGIGVGCGVKIVDDTPFVAVSCEASRQVTDLWTMVGQVSVGDSFGTARVSDVSCILRTDVATLLHVRPLRVSLAADVGFGWGHHFTSAATDHNYHTYTLAVDAAVQRYYVRCGCYWRTRNEHIGMRRNECCIFAAIGLRLRFGHAAVSF